MDRYDALPTRIPLISKHEDCVGKCSEVCFHVTKDILRLIRCYPYPYLYLKHRTSKRSKSWLGSKKYVCLSVSQSARQVIMDTTAQNIATATVSHRNILRNRRVTPWTGPVPMVVRKALQATFVLAVSDQVETASLCAKLYTVESKFYGVWFSLMF